MAQENPVSALKPIDRISARVRAIGLGGRSTWAVLRNLLSLSPGAGYNHYGVNPLQVCVLFQVYTQFPDDPISPSPLYSGERGWGEGAECSET
jgi:hypothetical protein